MAGEGVLLPTVSRWLTDWLEAEAVKSGTRGEPRVAKRRKHINPGGAQKTLGKERLWEEKSLVGPINILEAWLSGCYRRRSFMCRKSFAAVLMLIVSSLFLSPTLAQFSGAEASQTEERAVADVHQDDSLIPSTGNSTPIVEENQDDNLAITESADSLDMSFNPGANDDVYAIAVQADGKILVGGNFTALGGGTGTTTRNHIGRLNPDGSLDASFNPGANGTVWALAVQADGKILVGGGFTGLGGSPSTGWTPRDHIGRLNADGSLDTSFNPGAEGPIFALAVQVTGKILVGGDFSELGGAPRYNIGRLNANGSLDSFNPGSNDKVLALAAQADGKVWVGGDFIRLGGGGPYSGPSRYHIGRLNADGSLDTSFVSDGANNRVSALVIQPDGKILVVGSFTTLGFGGGMVGSAPRNYIGRLNANGSLDTNFDPGAGGTSGGDVRSLALQASGKILVGGYFWRLGGGGTGTTTRNYIGRLNSDGSLDTSFNPGANIPINAFALQADGEILLGGAFTWLGGGGSGTTMRNHIGRLNGDGPSNMQTLVVSKAGTGTGTVSSSPVGIVCGATCSAGFNSGTVVTLTASENPGSSFAGWSGDCTGFGACQVTMSQTRNVTATFTMNASCMLTCSATVPSTGVPGSAVAFSSTATPSNCTGTPTFNWNFGDGTAQSTSQNPSHIYASVGTYSWSLTAAVNGVTCQHSGSITITNSAPPPVISLMKKVLPPFKIVVTGTNLQNGIRVYINGVEWTSVVWKSTGKIQLKGALKDLVPKGVPVMFRFVNPDGGEVTTPWTR